MKALRYRLKDTTDPRVLRRRILREIYPDDVGLSADADAYVDTRAPFGFCRGCGLRNPHECIKAADHVRSGESVHTIHTPQRKPTIGRS